MIPFHYSIKQQAEMSNFIGKLDYDPKFWIHSVHLSLMLAAESDSSAYVLKYLKFKFLEPKLRTELKSCSLWHFGWLVSTFHFTKMIFDSNWIYNVMNLLFWYRCSSLEDTIWLQARSNVSDWHIHLKSISLYFTTALKSLSA